MLLLRLTATTIGRRHAYLNTLATTATRISAAPLRNQQQPPQIVAVAVRAWSSSGGSPSTPSPPNLPDRQQLEKFFFRIVAFLWDVSLWLYACAKRNAEKYVFNNPSVQLYYKRLLHKMAESKKN